MNMIGGGISINEHLNVIALATGIMAIGCAGLAAETSQQCYRNAAWCTQACGAEYPEGGGEDRYDCFSGCDISLDRCLDTATGGGPQGKVLDPGPSNPWPDRGLEAVPTMGKIAR